MDLCNPIRNSGGNRHSTAGNRLLWLDAARGIGMVLVVLGHAIFRYGYG